jgi:hypothetical protein
MAWGVGQNHLVEDGGGGSSSISSHSSKSAQVFHDGP